MLGFETDANPDINTESLRFITVKYRNTLNPGKGGSLSNKSEKLKKNNNCKLGNKICELYNRIVEV